MSKYAYELTDQLGKKQGGTCHSVGAWVHLCGQSRVGADHSFVGRASGAHAWALQHGFTFHIEKI